MPTHDVGWRLDFWVTTGVKIEIKDPADPTPYWLVSAEEAAALATALQEVLKILTRSSRVFEEILKRLGAILTDSLHSFTLC
jgi:hypothetical protein